MTDQSTSAALHAALQSIVSHGALWFADSRRLQAAETCVQNGWARRRHDGAFVATVLGAVVHYEHKFSVKENR